MVNKDINMKLKKVASSIIAVSILGGISIANATDLTANTNVTATVVQPNQLQATFTPDAPLIAEGSLANKPVGVINLSGYAGQPKLADVRFSDASGRTALTLKRVGGEDSDPTLNVDVYFNNKAVWVNNYNPHTSGNLSAGNSNFDLKLSADQSMVNAGEYADAVTVTLTNQ